MTSPQPTAADGFPGNRAPLPQARGIRLGRILGVQIQVDWSLFVIFTLISVSLGTAVFPAWHPEWSTGLVWAVALAAAVLFFASILVHELSHAVVARARGIPVPRITLFLFGGLAQMSSEPRTPKDELLIAAVGPLVSLLLGLLAWLAGSLLAGPAFASGTLDDPMAALARVGPLATLLLWLGPVNVMLALFNLVPGFPLDGGRVLRAILWWTTGDLVRASRWASGAGQLFAWILMGLGAWNVLTGGLTQGLWLMLIGWFLNNAARASFQRLLIRRALEGVPVRQLMFTRLERIPPEMNARELVEEHFMTSDQRAFPVEREGRFLGLVTIDDVRGLARDEWPRTMAGELMVPAQQLATLPPEADAERALEVMAQRDVDQVPIMDRGGLVGLVRRRDILKWLSLHEAAPAAG